MPLKESYDSSALYLLRSAHLMFVSLEHAALILTIKPVVWITPVSIGVFKKLIYLVGFIFKYSFSMASFVFRSKKTNILLSCVGLNNVTSLVNESQ